MPLFDTAAVALTRQKSFVGLTPGRDLQGGGGVGLAALVPGDDLDLSGVDVAALGDVEVPHAVVDQLVLASLLRFHKGLLSHLLETIFCKFCKY